MSASAATIRGTADTTITRTARQYRVLYQVVTNDAQDQGIEALMASGIPARTTYYAIGNNYDMRAYPQSYEARLTDQEGSRKVWEVTVDFATPAASTDQSNPPNFEGYDYPWDEPTAVSGVGHNSEERCRRHYTNPSTGASVALVNSAGDVVDDEMKAAANFGLQLRKNYHYSQWEPDDARPFTNAVNSAEFFGGPPGYYRMDPPRWSLNFTGDGIAWYDVEYSFVGRYDGWNGDKVIDRGLFYLDSATGKRKRVGDSLRLPISGKALLDGAGHLNHRLALPVTYPPGGVNKYREKDFGDLPIPTSIQDVLQGQ